jgi:hypothetical protein
VLGVLVMVWAIGHTYPLGIVLRLGGYIDRQQIGHETWGPVWKIAVDSRYDANWT